MKEEIKPLIGIGTELEISGHAGVVTAITREGVECKVAGRKVVLDFEKVASYMTNAASGNISPDAE